MATVRETRVATIKGSITKAVTRYPYLRGSLYDEDIDRLAEVIVTDLFPVDLTIHDVEGEG